MAKSMNEQQVLLFLIIFGITLCSIMIERNTLYDLQPSKSYVEYAIRKGLNFLYLKQRFWGEFATYRCKQNYCYFDSSPFVTTFVLYSLKDINHYKARRMISKGVSFLLSEKEPGGIWRYWSSHNSKTLPPDLDDTAVASFILKHYRHYFEDNLNVFLNNRDEKGLFQTWLWADSKIRSNDTDCVVNANVLLYLGDRPETAAACKFINDAIKKELDCSVYYPNRLVFYYMVSRAYANGTTCLKESKEKIIKDTLKRMKKDGSFGDELNTALAINIIYNLDSNYRNLGDSIKYLLRTQKADGSWARGVFFIDPGRYEYGSEELTTALVLEALQKYLMSKSITIIN